MTLIIYLHYSDIAYHSSQTLPQNSEVSGHAIGKGNVPWNLQLQNFLFCDVVDVDYDIS